MKHLGFKNKLTFHTDHVTNPVTIFITRFYNVVGQQGRIVVTFVLDYSTDDRIAVYKPALGRAVCIFNCRDVITD